MKVYKNLFERIISVEHLFSSWDAFKSDKRNKRDVLAFEWHLEENIFKLYRDLKNKAYKHGPYTGFYVTDPKQRHIHKALVRDRVLHHAIFSILNPIFEPTFITTSFSCRVGYGTHKGVTCLEDMVRKVSRNGRRPCFVLKCDVQKFFDSVDHNILLSILEKRITDKDTIDLLRSIVGSYHSQSVPRERKRERDGTSPKGIPIGNLTSQLFANIYLNELDQFVKHSLKVRRYVRYTDDFVIIHEDRAYLESLLPRIREFLREELFLELHPKKISIRSLYQGIDFLGYVVFSKHRLLRTETRRRIFRKFKKRIEGYRRGTITAETLEQSLQSYLGVLSHANAYQLSEELKNEIWFG